MKSIRISAVLDFLGFEVLQILVGEWREGGKVFPDFLLFLCLLMASVFLLSIKFMKFKLDLVSDLFG